MRWIVLVLIAITLQAGKIEITAKKFEASQKKLISRFIGDVVIKRNQDIIKSDEVTIYFNKKRKPLKVVAKGHIEFSIVDQKGKRYKGTAKTITYFPKRKEYLLQGNVHIVQLPDNKRLIAQEIFLNLANSKLTVKGSEQKPVKMIIKIDE